MREHCKDELTIDDVLGVRRSVRWVKEQILWWASWWEVADGARADLPAPSMPSCSYAGVRNILNTIENSDYFKNYFCGDAFFLS